MLGNVLVKVDQILRGSRLRRVWWRSGRGVAPLMRAPDQQIKIAFLQLIMDEERLIEPLLFSKLFGQ